MSSQIVEIRLLEQLSTEAPMFLNRKDNKHRRVAACQIWTKLENSDLIKEVENQITNQIEGKDFNDVLHVYRTMRTLLPYDRENFVAVRIQDGHKWSQIGDFEPK
jgi:hypothetical protein